MSDVSTTSSGLTGAGGGNRMRITGMNSGLDVDAMVKKMMAAEQSKMDKLKQEQDTIGWRQEAYLDIIKDIKDMQNSFFDAISTDKNILSAGNYAGFDVTGVNSAIANVTAGAGVKAGSYTVKVSESSKATMANSKTIDSLSTTLQNLGMVDNDSFVIDYNGTKTTIAVKNTDKLSDIINNINTKVAGVTASYDQQTGEFNIASKTATASESITISKGASTTGNALAALGIADGATSSGTNVKASVGSSKIIDGFSSTLQDMGFIASGSFDITYGNGTTKTISVNSTDKLSDIINNINTTTAGAVTASYNQQTGNFSLQSASAGSSQTIKISNDNGGVLTALGLTTGASVSGTDSGLATSAGLSNSLSGKSLSTKLKDIDGSLDATNIALNVNGLTIKLDNSATGANGNATLGDLVNAINNQSGKSLNATYSELTGKFTLNTSATGTAASLTIENGTTAGLSSVLGSYTLGAAIKNGTDAKVNINGTDIIKSSNIFTVDGVNYALTGTGTSTVNVGVNNDKVYDKIKGFIDKYNAVVDKIQTKLSEKKNYSYKPLTDTQRASMKDSEITAWETKAKAGVLRNDSNLKNLLDNLRSAFSTPVNGADVSMGKFASNSIGLDFSTDNLKPAHIDITDPQKLKDAIGAKGDQILKFFTNASTSNDKDTAYSESGVFTRINTIMESNVGKTGISSLSAILTKYANKQDNFSRYGGAGDNTLPDQLYQKQIAIDNMKTALATKEESYYQKFSRLETAMNSLNAQQSQLAQFTSQ